MKINSEIWKLIIGIFFYIISLVVSEPLNVFLVFLALIIISYDIVIDVIKSIRKGDFFDEKFLMLTATIGAILIGEYFEGIAVMFLYQIGELLGDKSVDKSRDDIIKLMDLRSDRATLLVNGEEKVVSPEKVQIDDIIIVKPGEKIPLDGVVVKGRSNIDASSITGESIPFEVTKNKPVISGTINLDGVLEIKVTSLFKDSTTSKIISLIEDSNKDKSSDEKFITKFAKIYTPIVVILAILITIIPTIITKDFNTWIYRGLTFLVASCPCALVISIPLSYFSGIGACSRKGILVKSSLCLEKILDIDEIIFDKTGTITEGNFEVTKVKPNKITEEKLLEIASLCEQNSNHPIALSIKKKAKKKLDNKKITTYREVIGGIKVTIGKDKYILGNSELLRRNKINVEASSDVGTIVYVSKNEKYLGYIVISDKIKPSSKKTIEDLKRRGINDLVVLSGDNEKVVKDVCHKVGIERYMFDFRPQDKVKYLRLAQKEGLDVMFVGDGVNDAPVLLNANLGVSMGGIGADASIESSDIVIMNDDLSKIGDAIDIAIETKKKAIDNIVFALSVKLIVLLLTTFGFSPMIFAVFADTGVTLITILNSLQLNKKRD